MSNKFNINFFSSDSFKRLRKNRASIISFKLLILLSILSLATLYAEGKFYPEPSFQNLSVALKAPSFHHPFGTDALGRDLFARVLAGSRLSLAIGLLATAVTLLIGVVYGAVAGFAGGLTDNLMMRFVDILYTLPFIFLVILLLGLFDRSLLLLFMALGAVQWLTMSRVVRGQVLSIKERDYISAARAAGASGTRILFRHILPNVMGVVIVYATLTVPVIILQEAFLSFLGLTVPGQEHSWGMLISEGIDAINPIRVSWWLVFFPGLMLSITLLSLNFLGDGLRDAFDPKENR